MGKTLLTVKAKCTNASKNLNGSNIQFAVNIEQTKEGPASREVVVFTRKDPTEANLFEINKEYTITVTDDK